MINRIRKNFIKTREFVITDIQNLQRKIEKKRKLSKLLKLLETVKYIDKANSTIKTLLDKTNYKKISELLVILNSNFSKNMANIKIFENRFERIVQLKNKFFKQLITIAVNKLESIIESANESFLFYVENFDKDKEFTLEINAEDTNEINSIILELRLFNKENYLYKQLIDQFQSKITKFNKIIVLKIRKMVIFKKPSLELLKSFRNYINHFYSVYQVTIPIEDNEEIYCQFLQSLTKNSNYFIREILAVFGLEDIDLSQIKEFIKVIGNFEKFSPPNSKNDNLFENIQVYFKKIVLNARQLNFFAKMTKATEDEEWTSSLIENDIEYIIKSHLGDKEISIFSQYIILDDIKYQFTKSFFVLLLYFNELEILNAEVDNLQTIYEGKLKDIIELYLTNCKVLILQGNARKYKKIKKINTKILSKINRFICSTTQFPSHLSWFLIYI